MEYFLTFIEGIISFISPCMLPMLPLYISYFSAGSGEKRRVLLNSVCFVIGFTVIFSLLGLFAGTVGVMLTRYEMAVRIICGVLVIIFGLSYLELIPLSFFKGIRGTHDAGNALSAFLFGVVYSLSLTPCVGAFLGSALMLAASSGDAVKGLALLLVYSLGLGIPFVLSALILDRLKGTFSWIKRHYKVINTVCGLFLITVGTAIAAGWLNTLISLLS